MAGSGGGGKALNWKEEAELRREKERARLREQIEAQRHVSEMQRLRAEKQQQKKTGKTSPRAPPLPDWLASSLTLAIPLRIALTLTLTQARHRLHHPPNLHVPRRSSSPRSR